MALIRWQPARELHAVQTEMDRVFNTLFDSPTQLRAGSLRRWVPATDLVTTDADYILRADLPGLTEDDVKIELDENVLTVSGERKSEQEERKEGYYRVERAVGKFSRSLTLPDGVDAEAITAHFENGVLEVRIPKPEQPKPRKVAITVGGAPKTIEGAEAETGTEPTAA
jgi:HSP20 family protein